MKRLYSGRGRSVGILGALILCMLTITSSFGMPLQHGMNLSDQQKSALEMSAYYVSEKLDGIRGYWDGSTLFSRQGYAIVTPDWFTAHLGARPLDGEIWLGRGKFQALSGLIARADKEDPLWEEVTYQIFDLPAEKGEFRERLSIMRGHIESLAIESPHLQMIDQIKLPSIMALDQQLQAILAQGGEGLMLHHQAALYRPYLRHDGLLKVKAVDEGCAVVIGFSAGQGKYEDLVGALMVEAMLDGARKRFKVGSGLTDAMRVSPPQIGSQILFLHNGLTESGVPRFPRVKAVDSLSCR